MINFGESLAAVTGSRAESSVHPHVPAEKGERFRAIEPCAAELEVLNFLNALVYLFKPTLLLETGTGAGLSAFAILCALESNQAGHLHTIELDPEASRKAEEKIGRLDPSLTPRCSFHCADSLAWIAESPLTGFDFVFFDSLIAFRHLEFRLLKNRGMLAPKAVCVFHDTSRLRGDSFGDFNPKMIEALDEESEGRQWLESDLSRGLRIIKIGK